MKKDKEKYWNMRFRYEELCLLAEACHEMQVHTKCMMVAAATAQDKKTYKEAVEKLAVYENLAYEFESQKRREPNEEIVVF